MFCENCGKEIIDGQKYCAHCGCEIKKITQSIEDKKDEKLINIEINGEPTRAEEKNIFSWGLFFISFFFWQVGLTLYIVYKKNLPVRAEACIRGMILGIIFNLALIFLGVWLLRVALIELISKMAVFFGIEISYIV